MRQIINEWREFCEEGKSFRDGHFYTLFMENITQEEIKVVYRTFPNSERLISRMNQFLFEKKVVTPIDEKKRRLEELLKLDFNDRNSILKKLPSISEFSENFEFVYAENSDIVEELI